MLKKFTSIEKLYDLKILMLWSGQDEKPRDFLKMRDFLEFNFDEQNVRWFSDQNRNPNKLAYYI